jgi:hypothetical protein
LTWNHNKNITVISAKERSFYQFVQSFKFNQGIDILESKVTGCIFHRSQKGEGGGLIDI